MRSQFTEISQAQSYKYNINVTRPPGIYIINVPKSTGAIVITNSEILGPKQNRVGRNRTVEVEVKSL